MIRVEFFVRRNDIFGFSVRGHSGYAPVGRDIVCSAVSSAVWFCVHMLQEEFVRPSLNFVEREGFIKLSLPFRMSRSQRVVAKKALDTLESFLVQLSRQYVKHVNIVYCKGR